MDYLLIGQCLVPFALRCFWRSFGSRRLGRSSPLTRGQFFRREQIILDSHDLLTGESAEGFWEDEILTRTAAFETDCTVASLGSGGRLHHGEDPLVFDRRLKRFVLCGFDQHQVCFGPPAAFDDIGKPGRLSFQQE
jgi:hypothetical protein